MLENLIQNTIRKNKYLIGLDLGTSYIKGVLMSADGTVVSRQKSETGYLHGDGSVVEFDAEEFYFLIACVIKRLVSDLPACAEVAGISMASASGNTLLVDEAGKPMIPAISWRDTRVTDEIKKIFGELNCSKVYELIGWPLLRMFPLAHLSWLKCHKPELLEKAAKVCMSSDYINFRLTGEWGIDNSTATTFFLQDQKSTEWHQTFLQKLSIPKSKLPPISTPGTILGRIIPSAASDTGLLPGTPVVLGSFDHPSAARGSGVTEEGQLLISCGTSWVGFYPVKERKKAITQKMLADPFLYPDGAWGAMFSLPAIATKVDKLVCKYISDTPERYREFDSLSASAQIGAGGLMINPMLDNETGELNYCKKADIARAIMEGTAYLLRMKMEQLEPAGIRAVSITMVGGPSETFPWPQIVADVLGMDISIINGSCAGAVGAAILAGIGIGLYTDVKDAFNKANFSKLSRIPDKSANEAYKDLYWKFKHVYILP